MPLIPLVDLKAQHAAVRAEIREALDAVLDSGAYILGEYAARFEKEFAAFTGARHAIAVNSGTDAIQLILEAIRLERGPGEVITTPFTFFATVESIVHAGHAIRFADIERDGFNLDPAAVRAAASPRTRVVMPVHLYGGCADVDALRIGDAPLVEDAAQAVGATYKGRPAGSLGEAAAFSFYPTKNLGAAGDAGAVTTSNDAIATRVRSLRAHGEVKAAEGRSYHYAELGHNSRMDGFQAAILSVKLGRLEEWQRRREANAAFYDGFLRGVPGVTPPPRNRFGRHVYHQYVLRAEQRDALKDHLARAGIESRVFYPEPLHLQPALRSLGLPRGAFPEAERAAAEALSIPVHSWLSEGEREKVATAVVEFYRGSC